MNLRYDLHFAIRVKAHMQPPEGVVTSEPLTPSFRAARREMVELHVALQRVLTNFGYEIDLDSLRGKLRTAPDQDGQFKMLPPGMAMPVGGEVPGMLTTTEGKVTGTPPV